MTYFSLHVSLSLYKHCFTIHIWDSLNYVLFSPMTSISITVVNKNEHELSLEVIIKKKKTPNKLHQRTAFIYSLSSLDSSPFFCITLIRLFDDTAIVRIYGLK